MTYTGLYFFVLNDPIFFFLFSFPILVYLVHFGFSFAVNVVPTARILLILKSKQNEIRNILFFFNFFFVIIFVDYVYKVLSTDI